MFGMAGETEFDLRFELLGVPIRVHPIFWISSIWIVWDGEDPRRVFVGVLCIFVSVLVHEMGHGLLSRRYGFPSEIVLYILGGYATATRFSMWKNVKVSAAGPAAGFVLFILTYIIFRILAVTNPESLIGGSMVAYAIRMMLFANLIVTFMNLVPCVPLDGGRITESLMNRYGGRDSTIRTIQIGIAASALVALRGLYCMNNPRADMLPLPQFLFPQFRIGEMVYSWHGGMIQPEPKFLLIFFGFLCAQQIIAYNEMNGRR